MFFKSFVELCFQVKKSDMFLHLPLLFVVPLVRAFLFCHFLNAYNCLIMHNQMLANILKLLAVLI